MGGWSWVVFGRFVFSAQLGINAGTWIHQENTQTWDISWIIQVPQNRACCRVYPWELSSCHQTWQWNIVHFSSMIFPMINLHFHPFLDNFPAMSEDTGEYCATFELDAFPARCGAAMCFSLRYDADDWTRGGADWSDGLNSELGSVSLMQMWTSNIYPMVEGAVSWVVGDGWGIQIPYLKKCGASWSYEMSFPNTW